MAKCVTVKNNSRLMELKEEKTRDFEKETREIRNFAVRLIYASRLCIRLRYKSRYIVRPRASKLVRFLKGAEPSREALYCELT